MSGSGLLTLNGPARYVKFRERKLSKEIRNVFAAVAAVVVSTASCAAVAQLPANAQLQIYESAAASVSVSGSMSYDIGSASGNASESDSNSTGQRLDVDWQRKGYGFNAFASAVGGEVKSYAAAIKAGDTGSSSANATAVWTDYFVISGDSALEYYYDYPYGYSYRYAEATAVLTAAVDGSIAGKKPGATASFSFSVDYSPVQTDNYYYCYYYYNPCPTADYEQNLVTESKSISGNKKIGVDNTYETEFTFRYNTPFSISSTLLTDATDGGVADFSHTGSFGLVLPEGALLLSASGLNYGAAYGAAGVVPEPGTWWLLAMGLGVIGSLARRRQA